MYLVTEKTSGCQYALKELRNRNEEKKSRFISEIQIARENSAIIPGILPVIAADFTVPNKPVRLFFRFCSVLLLLSFLFFYYIMFFWILEVFFQNFCLLLIDFLCKLRYNMIIVAYKP